MIESNLRSRAYRATMQEMSRIAMIGLLASGVAACVNVSAPDKPIVINLNISITQEVVYRLDGQAKTVIQSNPGIF